MPLILHIKNEIVDLLDNNRKNNLDYYMTSKYKENNNNEYVKEYFCHRLKIPNNYNEIALEHKFIMQKITSGNITANYLNDVINLLDKQELKFVSDYLFYTCNPLCFYSNLADYRTEDDMSYIFISFDFSAETAARVLLTNGISEKFKQYIKDIYEQSSKNNELLYELFDLSSDVSYLTPEIIETASRAELYNILIFGIDSDFIIDEFIYGKSKNASDFIRNINISALITIISCMKTGNAIFHLMTYFVENRANEIIPYTNLILKNIKNKEIVERLKPLFVLCSLYGDNK